MLLGGCQDLLRRSRGAVAKFTLTRRIRYLSSWTTPVTKATLLGLNAPKGY